MHRVTSASRHFRGWLVLAVASAFLASCTDPTTSANVADDSTAALAKTAAGAGNRTSNIIVTIAGLPAGTAASVAVAGPGGYARTLTASTQLTGLSNGTYTFTASNISSGGKTYAPSPTSRSVSVNKGSTGSASFTYGEVATTGALAVNITMPDATPAAVVVTGPSGFSATLTGTQTLSALVAGTYTVTASTVVNSGGVLMTPAPVTQVVSVSVSATSSATVAYTATSDEPGPTLNLQITNMYLTQSVQTLASGVPLVAGRDGVLRVFALANGVNTVQPAVRARVYRNGVLMSTLTAAAAQSAVPTSIIESSATASWNFAIAGSLIQGGMSILVDVDPSNLIPESSEADNQFPASGTPKTFDVRAVPALNVVFVPLKQNGTGQTGDVSEANSEAFLVRTRDMHPLNTVTSSVRAPYTTSYTVGSDGTNWNAVLSELRSVKTADGSNANYYGLLKVGYGSGVAGMGYIGSGTAIGWDYLPTGSEIMAHELGHNFGRQHAPCGGVSGADAAFPYAGGAIGVFGYNVRLGQLLQPSTADLMGYCSPTWISDYTYKAVLNFRGNSVASTTTSASVQPGLLVWGRVTTDGTIILEPATQISARSVLPTRGGAYTLQGSDASGNTTFSLSFDPEEVADETGTGERHFAFVVPMSDVAQDQLSTLTVRGEGKSAERQSRRSVTALESAVESASLDDEGAGRVRLRWSVAEQPMIVVRDANTGAILSFARGGNSAFTAPSSDVELVISDGVRSARQVKKVRGR